MMSDVFMDEWRARLRQLTPTPLVLVLEENLDAEHLSCIVCGHGHEDIGNPPEWLVTVRSPSATIGHGLHEHCRAKTARKQEPLVNALSQPKLDLQLEAALILEQEGWLLSSAMPTSSRMRRFAYRYESWQRRVKEVRQTNPAAWPEPEDNS